jgi:hypothetical protein
MKIYLLHERTREREKLEGNKLDWGMIQGLEGPIGV